MKYKFKIFIEVLVFIAIYGLQLTILTMSKVPQEAFGYTEIIHQTAQLDPRTYILLLAVNLILFSMFLKVSK